MGDQKNEEREKDHAHLDKERDAKEAALAASEAKVKDRVQERGERYAASRQKNEDDRKLLKSKHKVEISAVRKEKESEIEKVKVKARVKVAASKKNADGRVEQTSRCSARAQKKEKVCPSIFVSLMVLLNELFMLLNEFLGRHGWIALE